MEIDIIETIEFNLEDFIKVNGINKDNWENFVDNSEFINTIIEYIESNGTTLTDLSDYAVDDISIAISNYFNE